MPVARSWGLWADRWNLDPVSNHPVAELRLFRTFSTLEEFQIAVIARLRGRTQRPSGLLPPRTSLHLFREGMVPDVTEHPNGGHLTIRLSLPPDQWGSFTPAAQWYRLCAAFAFPPEGGSPLGLFSEELIGLTVLHKPTRYYALRLWLQNSWHVDAIRSVEEHAIRILGFGDHPRLAIKFSPHRFVLASIAQRSAAAPAAPLSVAGEAASTTGNPFEFGDATGPDCLCPPPVPVNTGSPPIPKYTQPPGLPVFPTASVKSTEHQPPARPVCTVLFHGETPFTGFRVRNKLS